ncbi:LysM domain-containing protein (plasmid) [Tetragenococcus halophilus]|uniref:LysM domain-containing protein n=1 Tax=Tetragenococcus halophilus TaxID=51669 RepID=A0A3G5FMF9_TETHA|nr:DUF6448 family protein [Tetragenococcus halophilus]AYW51481.1 LysM domain-containing protein [Tetragenococcus halophilus]GBD63198.1 LysM domain protein [Tetragenococcus halophilus subsp. flandriensis]GMA09223.1 hypothetical protein GCM10025886_23750 [Tetragenococcus halophilus subsp. flandriensis]
MKKLNLKSNMKKSIGVLLTSAAIMAIIPLSASAHCDTMDGPTVVDGKKAMESNNVNYVMKWVAPEDQKEITDKFNLSMKVKDQSPEAKELAEQYFFSEVVRVHRAGEGAPFDGLKPSGTPVDEKVLAADKSIEVGNLSPLEGMTEKEKMPELKERFEKVMSLKDYDVNDLEAGREYIEAYVKFFKFAEGEEEHAAEGAHGEEANNAHATHNAEANNGKAAAEAERTHGEVTYTVKPGDTLWGIGLEFNTTYQEIAKVNNISNPDLIFPGQEFIIPSK